MELKKCYVGSKEVQAGTIFLIIIRKTSQYLISSNCAHMWLWKTIDLWKQIRSPWSDLFLDNIFILKFQITLGEKWLLYLLNGAWIEKRYRNTPLPSKLYNTHASKFLLPWSFQPPLKVTMFIHNTALQFKRQRSVTR